MLAGYQCPVERLLAPRGKVVNDFLSCHSQFGEGILALYGAGKVLGFEIDRDEERLLLRAEAGATRECRDRLTEYQAHWSSSPATERAAHFLRRFDDVYSEKVGS